MTDASVAPQPQALCSTRMLRDGGLAVPFDVNYAGQTCRAFAICFEGQFYAYLNRCTHVAMELDWQPNRFFDTSGQWLLCASHGAAYEPTTGACRGGPCRGGLISIALTVHQETVYWHPTYKLKPWP